MGVNLLCQVFYWNNHPLYLYFFTTWASGFRHCSGLFRGWGSRWVTLWGWEVRARRYIPLQAKHLMWKCLFWTRSASPLQGFPQFWHGMGPPPPPPCFCFCCCRGLWTACCWNTAGDTRTTWGFTLAIMRQFAERNGNEKGTTTLTTHIFIYFKNDLFSLSKINLMIHLVNCSILVCLKLILHWSKMHKKTRWTETQRMFVRINLVLILHQSAPISAIFWRNKAVRDIKANWKTKQSYSN